MKCSAIFTAEREREREREKERERERGTHVKFGPVQGNLSGFTPEQP